MRAADGGDVEGHQRIGDVLVHGEQRIPHGRRRQWIPGEHTQQRGKPVLLHHAQAVGVSEFG